MVLTALWIVLSGNLDNAAIMVAMNFLGRYPGGAGLVDHSHWPACFLPALSWRLLTGPVTPVLAGRPLGRPGRGLGLPGHASSAWAAMVCGWRIIPNDRPGLDAVVPWLVVGFAIVKGIARRRGFSSSPAPRALSWRQIVGRIGSVVIPHRVRGRPGGPGQAA